jgi:hypothetical protein
MSTSFKLSTEIRGEFNIVLLNITPINPYLSESNMLGNGTPYFKYSAMKMHEHMTVNNYVKLIPGGMR